MNPSIQAREKLAAAPPDFGFAVLFSPREQRAALTALFAIYLEIHEILLECSDPDVARAKLGWWREEVSQLFEQHPRHPLTQNLARCVRDRALPAQCFMEIIGAVEMDYAKLSFQHFEEVERYCFRRGGALLELLAASAGARQTDTLAAARRMGAAWQLADIVLQAVVHARQGRVYFAADDLRRHRLDRHIVESIHTDSALTGLLADYAQRAFAFMDSTAANKSSEKHVLIGPSIITGLARARLRNFSRTGYRPKHIPVELHPFIELVTAWRIARRASL
jgi:15-cis-phytoene synthase